MAWEHFPVARGQRLTADMLNELAIAWNERGGSVGLFTRGQRIKNAVSTFLSGLRTAIRNSLSQWYHITWTSESNFSLKRMTADASSAETQNVFELALGPGITNWRGSVNSGLLTAEVLNDIYRVLDVLRVKAMSGVKAYCYQEKQPVGPPWGDVYFSCRESNGEPASLAQDAKPWRSPVSRPSPYPLTSCGLYGIGYGYWWQTHQVRSAARSQITIPAARRLYLRVHAEASREDAWDLGPPPGIGRNITLHVRYGPGAADISSVVNAAAWGSPLWSHTFPPGTHCGLWSEHPNSPPAQQFLLKLDDPPTGEYSFVTHADLDLSHHGAGLHNLSYWDGYEWSGEMGERALLEFGTYFVEGAYNKVTG